MYVIIAEKSAYFMCMESSDFKEQIEKDLKPMKYKHFTKGSKIGNTL